MLTLVVTTVFFRYFFLNSTIFLASDVIVNVYCIPELPGTASKLQEEHGQFTVASNVSLPLTLNTSDVKIQTLQTKQYKTEIIQIEYI